MTGPNRPVPSCPECGWFLTYPDREVFADCWKWVCVKCHQHFIWVASVSPNVFICYPSTQQEPANLKYGPTPTK